MSCPGFALEENVVAPMPTDEVSATEVIDISDADLAVSEDMTFEEMVSAYALSGGITYEEALESFPEPAQTTSSSSAPVSYRTLTATLTVSSTYKPHLEFYCEISKSGNYWGILSIYSVQLVRSYNGTSKQFSGDISVWLRSPYQIEYVVNGDFYHNGKTTTTGSGGVEFGIDELIKLTFSASSSTSNNHYKYFYDHKTVAYQS
jgi:hypothetical protein